MSPAAESKETLKQLKQLTTAMVQAGLSNEQNFPSTHGDPNGEFEITIGASSSMTIALKNVAYHLVYRELEAARCFNFKMADGALIALRYRFSGGSISEHSLSYFPSPDLKQFQNDPEIYLDDEIYADVLAQNIVPFPIRFDYSSDNTRFVELHHPYSHLTLGQYENCRIPVCSPLSPLTFGAFVLRNFYNTAYRKFSEDIPTSRLLFANTITQDERKIPHVVLG